MITGCFLGLEGTNSLSVIFAGKQDNLLAIFQPHRRFEARRIGTQAQCLLGHPQPHGRGPQHIASHVEPGIEQWGICSYLAIAGNGVKHLVQLWQ